MAETTVPVTSGSGNNIDAFSLTNTNVRQAVVIGDSSIPGNVAPIQAIDPSSSAFGIVVRDVNTSAIVAKLTTGVSVTPSGTGTMAVFFDQSNPSVKANAGTGTFTVQFDPGHELGSIKGTNSSLAVFLDPGHLLGSVTANAGTGTMTVQFDPGHELGSIKGNSNTLTVFLPDTGHEIGTIRGNTNTLTVFLPDTGHEIGTIRGNTNTLTVFLPDTGHTLGKIDQGLPTTGSTGWLVNTQGTASVFTASGSASSVQTAGNTIISPSANASFKIYAFSIQTTGQVSLTCKFTNGASSGPTEFFRPLITAAGVTGAQGANLASLPGFPLFVTGISTTLALLLDSATLVHYSVSYTKESA